MALSVEDRLAVAELIALHGHLVDEGQLARMAEVFTENVVYDLSDVGQGQVSGLASLTDAALARGPANPVAHHVTNVVVAERPDGQVQARSKGLAVMADGTCGSVTYDDTVVRGDGGWRISYRKVSARRVPLGGLGREQDQPPVSA